MKKFALLCVLSFSSFLGAAGASGGGAEARTSTTQSWLRSPCGENLTSGEIAFVLRELERKYPNILKDLIPRATEADLKKQKIAKEILVSHSRT